MTVKLTDKCDAIDGPCACGAWHAPGPNEVIELPKGLQPKDLEIWRGVPTPAVDLPGAKKYDAGKAPVVRGNFRKFPDAHEAVAIVSQYGATKYEVPIESNGWREILDGAGRYDDAEGRHSLRDGYDQESGLLHLAHRAWDALAALQLALNEGQSLVDPVRGIGPHLKIETKEKI